MLIMNLQSTFNRVANNETGDGYDSSLTIHRTFLRTYSYFATQIIHVTILCMYDVGHLFYIGV